MGQNMEELNDTNFGPTIGRGVTLVDFWAPWCGPCRMQEPILEEVAGLVDDRVRVAKINVDLFTQAARRYGVQGIPTLIVFRDGQPIAKFVGLQKRDSLLSAIRSALAQAA